MMMNERAADLVFDPTLACGPLWIWRVSTEWFIVGRTYS
jgi:hypothetical protein